MAPVLPCIFPLLLLSEGTAWLSRPQPRDRPTFCTQGDGKGAVLSPPLSVPTCPFSSAERAADAGTSPLVILQGDFLHQEIPVLMHWLEI